MPGIEAYRRAVRRPLGTRPGNMGVVTALMPTAQRELRAADLEAVRDQLGREPTTPFTVVARCTGAIRS